jgi:hypothetical protein
MRYGFGVLSTTMKYFLQRLGLARFRFLNSEGRKLGNPSAEFANTILIAEQAGEQTP